MRPARLVTFLFLLIAVPAVAQDFSGTWCGTTTQGRGVYLRVVNNAVTYARFNLALTGSSCPSTIAKTFSPAVAIQGGTAALAEPPASGVPVSWFGVVNFTSTTAASGTFSAQGDNIPGTPCSSSMNASFTLNKVTTPLTVTPTAQLFGSGGGPGRISVQVSSACPWVATENSTFLTLQNNSGDGEGVVTYTAATNSAVGTRTASINVNDVSVTVSQTSLPESRVLPVAGSLPGGFGSFFRTALQIHNRTSATMTGRIIFHPAAVTGASDDPSVSYSLAPGETRYFGDLLPAMNESGIGSVDIVSTAAGFPVTVARIFNDGGGNGTTGMTQDLLRNEEPLTAGRQGVLLAPSNIAAARFNVGIRTLTAGASLTITQRAAGGAVKRTLTRSYPATWFEQATASEFVGGAEVENGDSITIRVDSGSAVLYGSVTDNITQDPAMQIARPIPTALSNETRVLPVAGSLVGNFGSFFKTAVQIHNPGSVAMSGRFIFHEADRSGTSADPSLAYTLVPGQTLSYDDLPAAMNQSGKLGSIDIVPSLGGAPLTRARIYNDAGANGTTGMSQESYGAESILRRGESSVLVTPPDMNVARFNIGVRTMESATTMTVIVRDSGGRQIRNVNKSYGPNFFQQTSAETFLGDSVPANGSLTITINSGSAILYGATTDNTTQDPSVQFTNRNL